MKLYRYIWCVYFALFFYNLNAQNDTEKFNVVNYTIEDGLPSNQLYEIYQDSLGNLWIGSDHGLIKFDGQKMQIYGVEDGLPDEVILKMYEDDKHRLWLITYTGGVCYLEKGKFVIPSFNDRLLELLPPKIYINQIAVVNDEVYMSGTDRPTFYFKATIGGGVEKVELTDVHESLDTDIPTLLWTMKLENGESLIGLYENRHQPQTHPANKPGIWCKEGMHRGKKITFCQSEGSYHVAKWKDKNKEILVFDGRALIKDSTGVSLAFDFNSHVLDIEKIGEDYFVPLVTGGLMHFEGKVDSANLVGHYLKPYLFNSISKDRQSRLWITTQYNGLFKVSSSLKNTFQIPQGQVIAPLARPVYLKKDTLKYVKGDTLHIYYIDDNELVPLRQYFLKSVTSPYKFEKVAWLPDGDLFFRYHRFDIKQRNADSLEGISWTPTYERGFIRRLYTNEYGTEILGVTSSGFFLMDSTGFQYDSKKSGFNKSVYCLVQKNEGEFLLGTQVGLIYFNTATQQFRKSKLPVLNNPIRDMAVDHYGRVWILPKGRGVVVLDQDSVFRISKALHLSSDVCHTILIDSNEAWIGSNNGLNLLRFDEKGIVETHFFGPQNGIDLDYIDHIVKDGSSIFAFSEKKFSRLKKPLISPRIPHVSIIEKIEVGETSYTIPQLKDIQMQAGDNDISFHYRINTLLDDNRIWYKYRLLGREEGWTYTHNREARYLDLPPGNYTFQLMSRDAHGLWSKTTLEYSFFIPKYFYEKWWFRITAFLLVLSLVILLAEMYKRRQQKKMFVKHQLLRSGIHTLKAQMNPHFMFNALNSVRHLLLFKKNEEADLYLTKFSGLLRGLLNDMEQSKTSLAAELDMIRNYLLLEEMRIGETFRWQIEVQNGLDPGELLIPPMLIQPLLENAIWHGLPKPNKEGKISVSFYIKGTILYCVISDNGKGFDPRKTEKIKGTGRGLGLRNIKERLALLREFDGKPYAIKIESQPEGGGTQIILSIPQ